MQVWLHFLDSQLCFLLSPFAGRWISLLVLFFTERLAFNSSGFPYKCVSHQLARVARALYPGLATPVANQAPLRGKWWLIQLYLLLDPVDFPYFLASWLFERMFVVFQSTCLDILQKQSLQIIYYVLFQKQKAVSYFIQLLDESPWNTGLHKIMYYLQPSLVLICHQIKA